MQIAGLDVSNYYIWGVFGSAAVEIVAAVKAAADNGGSCPPPYNKPFYVGTRVLLAAMAGFIPVALDVNSAINALYLGAGAPVFLDKAKSGLQQNDNGQA